MLEYENQAPDQRIQPRINIEQESDIPEYDIYVFCDPDLICTETPELAKGPGNRPLFPQKLF